jgi:hypothetical protein
MPRPVVVALEPVHFEVQGMAFLVWADKYRQAAKYLDARPQGGGFDPVVYYLFCLSLELYLKAFIWLRLRPPKEDFKSKYRHDLVKLWEVAKHNGIGGCARATPLRDRVIALVGQYYKKRQLTYHDLQMISRGMRELMQEPRVVPVLRRLTHQLQRSIEQPILSAS